jgi:hypothetical protein
MRPRKQRPRIFLRKILTVIVVLTVVVLSYVAII